MLFEQEMNEVFGALGKLVGKQALKTAGREAAETGVKKGIGVIAKDAVGQGLKQNALNLGIGALNAISGGADEEGDSYESKLGNYGALAGNLVGDVAGGVAGGVGGLGVGAVPGAIAGGAAGGWLGRFAGKTLGKLIDKFSQGGSGKTSAVKQLAKLISTANPGQIINVIDSLKTKSGEKEDFAKLLKNALPMVTSDKHPEIKDAIIDLI